MDIVFIDNSFDLNQNEQQCLSIEVSTSDLSFTIFDQEINKYILLKHYSFELTGSSVHRIDEPVSDIIERDEFLSRQYKSVIFCYNSPLFTLVPGPLFKPENIHSYIEFNHLVSSADEVLFNRVDKIDAYNVFVVPEKLTTLIADHFGPVKIINQLTPFIDYGIENFGKTGTHPFVLMNVYGNSADIAVINNSKLLLATSFNFSATEDIIFNILNIFDKLKLLGDKCSLVIMGEVKKDSEFITALRKYVKNLIFAERSKSMAYSYAFQDIDSHRFVNLFNLLRCE